MFRSTYIDCEFIRDDLTNAGLISMGLTDRSDADYYAINADMDEDRIRNEPGPLCEWLREHVWPLLPLTATGALDRTHPAVKPIAEIREEVKQYYEGGPQARLYAYLGLQDGCRLHGLWNHDWSQMPLCIPQRVRDLADAAEDTGVVGFPPQQGPEHHALWDAKHNRVMHEVILMARGHVPTLDPKIGEQQLRQIALSAQLRGPGLLPGRTKEELAAVMPDWMREAVDAYVPGLAELHAAADIAQRQYRRALVEWMTTLDS